MPAPEDPQHALAEIGGRQNRQHRPGAIPGPPLTRRHPRIQGSRDLELLQQPVAHAAIRRPHPGLDQDLALGDELLQRGARRDASTAGSLLFPDDDPHHVREVEPEAAGPVPDQVRPHQRHVTVAFGDRGEDCGPGRGDQLQRDAARVGRHALEELHHHRRGDRHDAVLGAHHAHPCGHR